MFFCRKTKKSKSEIQWEKEKPKNKQDSHKTLVAWHTLIMGAVTVQSQIELGLEVKSTQLPSNKMILI